MAVTTFKWVGRDRAGSSQKGVIQAENEAQARTMLRQQQIIASSVRPAPKAIKISLPGFGAKVKEQDIVIFTRQFATMIEAGLPLVQCLGILEEQTENPALASAVSKIKADVEGGQTYAESLASHPNIFNNLYVNMIRAGELGGILDTILARLSAYIEKAMALKAKIKSAMTYPAAIVGVSILIVIFLLVFVIPQFAKMFDEFGATLPAPTLIVMGLSNFVKNYIVFGIVGIIIGLRLFKTYYKTYHGRRVVDAILLKLPVVGMLLRKIAVAKFTRTLGTLISSGVPIIDGMEIVARTSGNAIVEDAIMGAINSIKEGESMSTPLGEANVFPPMVIQMIQVGEQTGALDSMLSKIADFYDEEVDTAVEALTALMEPMIMVFLGAIIGGVVVAMYLPIFKLAATVG